MFRLQLKGEEREERGMETAFGTFVILGASPPSLMHDKYKPNNNRMSNTLTTANKRTATSRACRGMWITLGILRFEKRRPVDTFPHSMMR